MRQKLLMLSLWLCFTANAVMAQVKSASGVVYSAEDGEPLIGASVKVKGTTTGMSTDFDGKFSLKDLPADAKFLEISYIGFQSQTVAIKPNLKITLKPDSKEMEQVVVTGMQKMDKRLFSGATVKLDAEKMKIDGMADISRGWRGVLPVCPSRIFRAPLVQHPKSVCVELLPFMGIPNRYGW